MPSNSNLDFSFDPNPDPNPKTNFKTCLEEATPFGPSILSNGVVFFNYLHVDPNITNLSVIFTTHKGEIISKIPLERTPSTNNFSSILTNIPSPYYRLSVQRKNGEEISFVDPAARFLPNGVHLQDSPLAIGQIIDQDHYEFLYPRPPAKKNMLISQIHVGTRTSEGTFKALIDSGIIKKLSERHFDAIKFLPLMAVPGKWNWGYDGTAHPYSISQNYGTVDDFKRVVDEAHKYGMRVIMDLVFNHFSSDIESQECLLGKNIFDQNGNDWGRGANFDNQGISEFDIRCAEYFLSSCNIDGIRIDAAHILPAYWLDNLIVRAKKVYPDVTIIHEGYLKEEHKHLERLHSNFYSYSNGNMNWLSALLLTPKRRFAWFKKLNDNNNYPTYEKKIDYVVSEISYCNELTEHGINHDFSGNIAPFYRLPQQMILARGPKLGLSAARLFLSVCLTTPGNKVVFNGDEDGIITSPFTFFQKHLSDEANEFAKRDRVRECGNQIIHNEDDLTYFNVFKNYDVNTYNWDGTLEQLRELVKAGIISRETYKYIHHFDPNDEITFKKALIYPKDLESSNSQSWVAYFDKIVDFARTIEWTELENDEPRVFTVNNTYNKAEVIGFRNMRLKDTGEPIFAFANPVEYPQQIILKKKDPDNRDPNNTRTIVFNSNQGVENVDTPTLIDDMLTIPPFCIVYIKFPKE